MNVFSLTVLLSLLSTQSNAQDCKLNIRPSLMFNSFKTRHYEKVARIMTKKGYQVVEGESAPNTLRIGAAHGFICGTGLTNREAIFKVPALY